MVPKLFGPIRKRYEERPGGYTRILRIEPMKEDQAESAILELVDGPKDMRFAMTAKTLANRHPELGFTPGLTTHVKKVTRYRKGGMRSLRQMVERMRIEKQDMDDRILAAPKKVYPEEKMQRSMHYFEDVDPGKLPNRVAPKKMSMYREQKARQRMRGQMSTRAKKIVPKKKDRQMLKGDRSAVAGVPKAGVEKKMLGGGRPVVAGGPKVAGRKKMLKSGRPVVAGRQKASGEKKISGGGRPAVAGGQKAGGDKKKQVA
jgi:hypothetical protein